MRLPIQIVPILAILSLSGCKPVNDRKEITVVRDAGEFTPKPQLGLSLKERLGLESKSPAGNEAGPPFAWDKPEPWREAPASAMRVANFKFGSEDSGECYFTVLPGGGGGLLLNLNRWRKQLGLPEVDQAGADALPDRKFLFGSGKLVDIEGSFTPMGATEAQEGYRLLGVIMPQVTIGDVQVAFFVKMTGPGEVVDAERANFDAFCDSLKVGK
jgi:hypothetical protein